MSKDNAKKVEEEVDEVTDKDLTQLKIEKPAITRTEVPSLQLIMNYVVSV
jgi:hypothetical protein